MTNEQKLVASFMRKAGQDCPEKPIIPDLNVRKLRARLMLEEVLETINDGLGLKVKLNTVDAQWDINIDCIELENWSAPDLVELADGLADLSVVGYCGAGNAFGIDMEEVFAEVCRSNDLKFAEGWYKRDDGKVMKSPKWSPPDIKSIIEKQMK